jgi:hypothetical protein
VQFRDEFDRLARTAAAILLVSEDPYSARNPIPVLAQRMDEPRRLGLPNQFSEAQRAGVQAMIDLRQCYGSNIASIHFPETRSPSEETGPSGETARTDLTIPLFQMKVRVLVDAVRHNRRMNEDVLVIALLKVKQWLADPAAVPRDKTNVPGRTLIDAGIRNPGLEVCVADSRALAFSFTAPIGTRALFSIGPTNAATIRLGYDIDLPELLVPNISLILVNAAGRAVGSAYVAADDEPGTPVDRLALLIKRLDFAREFLRLTSLEPARNVDAQRINAASRSQLLKLAEEL